MSKQHLSPSDTDLVFSSMADCSVSDEQRSLRLAPLTSSAPPTCKQCAAVLAELREQFAATSGTGPRSELETLSLAYAHAGLFWHLVDVLVFNRLKRFGGRASAARFGAFALKLEWDQGPSVAEVNAAVQRSSIGRHLRVVLHRRPPLHAWKSAVRTMEQHFGIELPLRLVTGGGGALSLRWDEWADIRIAGETLVTWGMHVVNRTHALPSPTQEDVHEALGSPSPAVRKIGFMMFGKLS